jgi:tetratricopeptide (TPR) repeat protein
VSLEPAVAGIVPEVVADRVEAIDWYDVEHATLMAVIQLAEAHELDRSVVDLAEILRTHLNRSGRWQHWHDWITVQESAIRSARRSGDQPGEANALLVLGRAYGRLGRYEEVVAPCEASREICRRLDDLYGQAQAEQTLSMVADFLLRHDLSLDHARRALDLYHVIGYGVGELTMTHHIGVTYTHLGQYELALSYCLQALSWLQDAPEADYTELGGIWDSLGLIHLRMGDPHQAADYYGRSVGIYEEAGERYFHANALARVGEALAAAGDPVGAHEHRVSALAILDDLQHPDADTVRELL